MAGASDDTIAVRVILGAGTETGARSATGHPEFRPGNEEAVSRPGDGRGVY
jgi:hypothetical protein